MFADLRFEYCGVLQRKVKVLRVDKRRNIVSTFGPHSVLSNHYLLLYRIYSLDADCLSLCGTTLLPPEETEPDAELISYFDQIFREINASFIK
jgi:hypothetical protein